MGKSRATSNSWLNLVFNATAIANLADNAASLPNTSLYVSLHTSDPGVTGNQTTNEIAYGGYARVAVQRTSSGWTVSTLASTSPAANITFPAGTSGSGTATYFSIGMLSAGAGVILYSGPITPNIICGAGVVPQLTTASTITES